MEAIWELAGAFFGVLVIIVVGLILLAIALFVIVVVVVIIVASVQEVKKRRAIKRHLAQRDMNKGPVPRIKLR